ncbi:2-isopropylmalate synthase [Alphaproteobacteria bacterium]|jgi:2-isopropylmalate synthase|nr:2-isopropylmalate synthase [Alphaproteobacteria bacterium]
MTSSDHVSATASNGNAGRHEKYRSFAGPDLRDRTWPGKRIETAPVWCSVDLRDGNQALIEPMDSARKMRMFKLLVDMGFKEIEVGFPSASDTDFNFLRDLIDGGHVPDDVTIQVLTQAREHLIDRTIDSLDGAPNAILHLYNSTSTLQRRVVFKADRDGVKQIAVDGAKMVAERIAKRKSTGNLRLQYSPESFTGTELDYALEVCEAVMDVWQPTAANPTIINLPATVEMSTPNIYADQIEWMHRNFSRRDAVILSLHPHNDRGCAVAATELGLMAGADRVEGTLFGNGERTGNVDIVTLGLNMFTQGVNPTLDFSDINNLVESAEFCNQLPVHERHPYAGKLVHTAFSGSHQDAIRKGIEALDGANEAIWQVPYLPIDPADIGRTFEEIIRVNSQSGKAGSAYLLETDHHVRLPRGAEIEFSGIVQDEADNTGKEITSDRIWELAQDHFIRQTGRFELISFDAAKANTAGDRERITAILRHEGKDFTVSATGNGPISAFVDAVRTEFGLSFKLADFGQNTRSATSKAEAAAYVEIVVEVEGKSLSIYGVGIDTSITMAPIRAVISALNKL